MSLTITPATLADVETLVSLARATFLEAHPDAVPESDFRLYMDEFYDPRRIAEEIRDPGNLTHLAWIGGKAVGFSKISLNTPHELVPDPNVAKLARIYFLHEHVGKGIGRQLYEFNRALALENRQTGFWLTVWPKNYTAIEFYKKRGFKKVADILFQVGTVPNPNDLMHVSF